MAERRQSSHRRDWEELAEFNPEWAVLTEPRAKFDGWDREAFVASGTAHIAEVMGVAAQLARPAEHRSVLDFGCGIGRLAPPLSERFERYVGVDVAGGMVERARELNAELGNAEFVLNPGPDLSRFSDGEFDAVVSFLVLQHVPGKDKARAYLEEFTRILAPEGLIAVQVPSHVPFVYRLRIRRRLYRVARALGVGVERAHRMGLQSMWFQALHEPEVEELFESRGCRVLRTVSEARGAVQHATYYVTRPG